VNARYKFGAEVPLKLPSDRASASSRKFSFVVKPKQGGAVTQRNIPTEISEPNKDLAVQSKTKRNSKADVAV